MFDKYVAPNSIPTSISVGGMEVWLVNLGWRRKLSYCCANIEHVDCFATKF